VLIGCSIGSISTLHSGTSSCVSDLFLGSFVTTISMSIDSGPERVCFTVNPPQPYCKEVVIVGASHLTE
jgi:hypothetical protein